MRFKKLKMGLASGMMAVMMLASAGSAFAASTYPNYDTYSVNYLKGAPSTSANPVKEVTLVFYGNGYKANATTFKGSDDRLVTITSSDASGMKTQYITVSNTKPSWKMNGSTSGGVKFRLVASGAVSCTASGRVAINN